MEFDQKEREGKPAQRGEVRPQKPHSKLQSSQHEAGAGHGCLPASSFLAACRAKWGSITPSLGEGKGACVECLALGRGMCVNEGALCGLPSLSHGRRGPTDLDPVERQHQRIPAPFLAGKQTSKVQLNLQGGRRAGGGGGKLGASGGGGHGHDITSLPDGHRGGTPLSAWLSGTPETPQGAGGKEGAAGERHKKPKQEAEKQDRENETKKERLPSQNP